MLRFTKKVHNSSALVKPSCCCYETQSRCSTRGQVYGRLLSVHVRIGSNQRAVTDCGTFWLAAAAAAAAVTHISDTLQYRRFNDAVTPVRLICCQILLGVISTAGRLENDWRFGGTES